MNEEIKIFLEWLHKQPSPTFGREYLLEDFSKEKDIDYRVALGIFKKIAKESQWSFISGRRGRKTRLRFVGSLFNDPSGDICDTDYTLGDERDDCLNADRIRDDMYMEISLPFRGGNCIKHATIRIPSDATRAELDQLANRIKKIIPLE